jgi:hypothetical protein
LNPQPKAEVFHGSMYEVGCPDRRVLLAALTRHQVENQEFIHKRLYRREDRSFDLLVIPGRERQVEMRGLLLGLVQAQ